MGGPLGPEVGRRRRGVRVRLRHRQLLVVVFLIKILEFKLSFIVVFCRYVQPRDTEECL